MVTTNKNLKHLFVGISLGSNSGVESGIAILDKDLKIITLDKVFTMNDLNFFFQNFVSKKNSIIMVSLAEDATMLNSKWKVLAKKFQILNTTNAFTNRQNWLNMYTNRACELLQAQKDDGVDIFRFDIIALKKALGVYGVYKHRTPADCKYLQSALKIKFLLEGITNNMLPAAQLEAILGAILARTFYTGQQDVDWFVTETFKEMEIINIRQDYMPDGVGV